MPPIWPFKKKKQKVVQLNEAPPAPVVYKRGEDPNARDVPQTDVAAYRDALALFGGGSDEVNAATDQSVHYEGASEPSVSSPAAASASTEVSVGHTWVHHTDGYHYKRMKDGSFDSTPHTKGDDGSYTPYS
ncbi:MAG TPA: hypothetical protein HA353_07020 [Candidatus Poseidonia sp.]|nr:hypothetical protein [Poseidonia sp.]|tara:strand:+ start:282 stop:674 length:393 start_codon:yes stop_codon:yes gene_type:complete